MSRLPGGRHLRSGIARKLEPVTVATIRSAVPWVLCLIALCHSLLGAAETPDRIVIGGAVLRTIATATVLPRYPLDSARRGVQGTAVAEVVVGVAGSVESVTILEAPDRDIGASVSAALSSWRFRPSRFQGRAVRASGRLVFVFQLVKGKPVVIDANSAGAKRSSSAEGI